MFVHEAEFVNDEDKKILDTIKNIEEAEIAKGKHVQYEWLDINDLDKYEIRPGIIKDVLKKGTFPVHVVNKEF